MAADFNNDSKISKCAVGVSVFSSHYSRHRFLAMKTKFAHSSKGNVLELNQNGFFGKGLADGP